MIILGIESSCDDCCVALVRDGAEIIDERQAGQEEAHASFGGVVPEIAARAHTRTMLPLFLKLLRQSGVGRKDIGGVAVTEEPGLHNSLVVGVAFARSLAYALGVPCVGVNHLYAHLYAAQMNHPRNAETLPIAYPHLGVIVSGGHTLFGIARGYRDYEVLGGTVDDACGEAFDKVASHLGMGYPGGRHIERLAQTGHAQAASLPRAEVRNTRRPFDISYSGLKTAAIHQRERFWNTKYPMNRENIAAAFQDCALDMITQRVRALIGHTGLSTVVCGGGVCVNQALQRRLRAIDGATVHIPPPELCTDNAAMIGGIGFWYIHEPIDAHTYIGGGTAFP